MNTAVLVSACVAVLQVDIGALLLFVSRAPNWRGARIFAVIAFSAAGYSAGNITWAYFPMSDATRVIGARVSYCMAGVFVAAMCIAFFRGRGAGTRVNRQYLIGVAVFLLATVVELLVSNGDLQFFLVADVGLLAVVVPMAAQTVRRVIEDSQRLAEMSSHLTEEIEIRTHERDEAQQALLGAERQAAIGRLAAGVEHEINNPLAYLRLNVELIGEWARDHSAPPELMESVESALDGADRIRGVIDTLRAYSRPGTGHRTSITPESFTQAALRVAAPHLREARVHATFDHAPSIMGEAAKLVQVMVNLLLNSAQAISESSTGRKGEIHVRVSTHPSGKALIEIRDNGPGIPRDDLRRLTQPYFTTRAKFGGTGLGLFLARGVVEQHGGALEIDSHVGVGTVVRVTIPPASEAPPAALEAPRGRHATPVPGVRTSPA